MIVVAGENDGYNVEVSVDAQPLSTVTQSINNRRCISGPPMISKTKPGDLDAGLKGLLHPRLRDYLVPIMHAAVSNHLTNFGQVSHG